MAACLPGCSDPSFIDEAPNRVTDAYGTVGGGYANRAGDDAGTTSDSSFATVGGGQINVASDFHSTVGGGSTNSASGNSSSVSGGDSNSATNSYASVGGGQVNLAGGQYSSVAGGGLNHAAGRHSAVGGGLDNCAGGDTSWAGGNGSKIRPGAASERRPRDACNGVAPSNDSNGDAGTFVWSDSQSTDFTSTGDNQFLVRAQGGVAFNGVPSDPRFEFSVFGNTPDNGFVEVELTPNRAANGYSGERIEIGVGPGGAGMNDASFRIAHRNDQTTNNYFERLLLNGDGSVVIRSSTSVAGSGVQMAPGAGSWSSLSDRQLKTALRAIDTRALLDRLVAIPVQEWSYIAQGVGVRHIGPMAQDFKAAFSVGENDTTISTVDADGVALAAIQGLNEKLESRKRCTSHAHPGDRQAELTELRTLIETQAHGRALTCARALEVCTVLVLAALLPLFAAASAPTPTSDADRFRVSAQIRLQTRSDDGRFALMANVRVVPAARSLDGRFALKAVNVPNVGCEPFADGIFANGFENP